MNPAKCNLSFEEREPIAVLIKFGAGFDDIKNEFEKRFNKRLRLDVTRIFIRYKLEKLCYQCNC